jgi:flagellar biogenesis protein FliO
VIGIGQIRTEFRVVRVAKDLRMSIRNRIWDLLLLALAVAAVALGPLSEIRADHPTPTAALVGPAHSPRPFPSRESSVSARSSTAEGGSGWWIGTAGAAFALALVGWMSVASKRYLPKASTGSVDLRVISRTSLSPKQSVYLVKVGDRVLIVGGGGQGAPSLLGELSDSEALAKLAPRGSSRIDTRVGDNS